MTPCTSISVTSRLTFSLRSATRLQREEGCSIDGQVHHDTHALPMGDNVIAERQTAPNLSQTTDTLERSSAGKSRIELGNLGAGSSHRVRECQLTYSALGAWVVLTSLLSVAGARADAALQTAAFQIVRRSPSPGRCRRSRTPAAVKALASGRGPG